MIRCKKCAPQHTMTGAWDCLPKCICTNGVPFPFSDPRCRRPGQGCQDCQAGYWLNDLLNTCSINRCRCRHGFGTEGPNCPKHGNMDCASCNKEGGYVLAKNPRDMYAARVERADLRIFPNVS